MPGSAYAPEAPKIAAAGIADGTRILIMKVPPSFRGEHNCSHCWTNDNSQS
jgi:hypothetical protein